MPARKVSYEGKLRPKMSIRRDDTVEVIAGKDRGKQGRVTRVMPEANRIIVDGVNMVKRHMRRQPGSLQAGIIDMPAALNRSNVMLICPNCNQPTRVAHAELENGQHVRTCKKCHEIVDKER